MSLFKTLSHCFVLLIGLAVAGCGFAPVYGTNSGAQALQNRVLVNAPNTREDYALVRQIERRLGRAETIEYRLNVDLEISEDGVAITPDGDITRYNVTGTATYVMTNATTDATAASGTVSTFTSYSAVGTTVVTLNAQEDARDRLAVALADLILSRLLADTAS